MLLVSGMRTNFSMTESSLQLDLESGTICRRTSDSWTYCHTAISDSRWRCFYCGCRTKVQCEFQPSPLFALCKSSYLFTY